MTENTNDNQEKLEGKLVESIKIKGLGDVAQEGAELGIDLIMKDGVLRDIPIVGTLANAAKIVGSIRDRLYMRKLICFLQKVGETTQEQREKFVEDNCQDVKQFEETILLLIEQADKIGKSILIGKIFKACILGKIEYEGALTLSSMVNRAFWNDLGAMFSQSENPVQQNRLFLSGLYENDEDINDWKEMNKFKVKKSKYAHALIMINIEYYDQVKKIKN